MEKNDYQTLSDKLEGVMARLQAPDIRVDEAVQLYPALFDGYSTSVPGEIVAPVKFVERYMSDPEADRNGRSALFHVVHRNEAGNVDGYLSYRTHPLAFAGSVHIERLIAADPVASIALGWYFNIRFVMEYSGGAVLNNPRPIKGPAEVMEILELAA